jgi:hypothetical protein
MPRTCRYALVPAIAVSAVALAGCSAEIHRYVQFPNFFQPGPTRFQRSVGIAHDPYPLDEVGPAVVGGRPLAIQQVPEVVRARLYNPPRRPLKPLFAPTVVTTQAVPEPWLPPPTPYPPPPVTAAPVYPSR